jgi:benzoyl-CoA reductase/2-hydroxyglutaryl-CoA dehydratase subunit BcrC/BadD/HgdB
MTDQDKGMIDSPAFATCMAASIFQTAAEARNRGVKTVGYSCPSIPEELITAAGMLPLRIPPGEENSSMPALDAFCVMHKCQYYPDATEKSPVPVLSLELPDTNDDYDTAPPAAASFKKGLKAWRIRIEEIAGKKIKQRGLREAVDLTKEIRESLRSLFEYPRREDSPIEWRELLELCQSGFLMDRADFTKIIDKLNASLRQKISEGVTKDARPRLMIAGSPLGINDRMLLDIINQTGGVVVADCICNGSMLLRKRVPVFSLVENLMESLEDFYLYNVPCPCRGNTSRRVNYILKTARDFRVHGLIYYSGNNSCMPSKDQAKPVKERLYRELLVPTLMIDGFPAGTESAVRDRLNSFIDIVGGRV